MPEQPEPVPTTPGLRAFLIGAPLLVLLAVSGVDLVNGVQREVFLEARPTLARVLDGRYGKAVGTGFERGSRAMRLVRPYWNELMLGLFLETPSKVAVGHQGWMFYTASLVDRGTGTAPEEIRTLEGLRRALPDGTPFAVLVMPTKARLVPELVRGANLPGTQPGTYERAREELARHGFSAPDVLAMLREEAVRHPGRLLFPPNDTHLTPFGFRRLVERFLPELLDIDPIDVARRLDAVPREAEHVFYGELQKILELRRDSAVSRRYDSVGEWYDPPPAHAGRGELLLVGDSFAAYYDRLLPRLLQVASDRDVDSSVRQAIEAKRFDLVKEILDSYREQPPELVICILSERRFE